MQGFKGRFLSLPYIRGMSGVFSGKVEESLRLRLLGLAAFWLVLLAVAWVGGSLWAWLGGGIIGTLGHAFSWHRRHRGLGAWTLVMAMMVIALAMVMRLKILAALDGNWLPLAHFLLLVQAISSFDIRTRGGLYAGLGLSGIVLFFASQQAFELSFGIFLVSYVGLLLTFLAIAYIEDESREAQVRPAGKGVPLMGFWGATAVTLLVFSMLAFMLLPRGDRNGLGYEQVNALAITGEDRPSSLPIKSQSKSQLSPGSSRGSEGRVAYSEFGLEGYDLEGPGDGIVTSIYDPESRSGSGVGSQQSASPSTPSGSDGDGVVMHVRSPVASYWRGRVFDTFDGTTWYPESKVSQSKAMGYIRGNILRYTQTYFIHQPQPDATFTGYRGVKILLPQETEYQRSLGEGYSYKVISIQPDLLPENLREDRPGTASANNLFIPQSMDWLRPLAYELTGGAETGYDQAISIVEFLRNNRVFNASAPNQMVSSMPMKDFLLDGNQGTSMDFATATVMLGRAAGLPTRLATGCLPGQRDLLSGAYAVRGQDAHAWAEILFNDHGWVPFDGAPRPELAADAGNATGSQLPGLDYLFESSVGDDLLKAAVGAPSKLTDGLKDAFTSPATAALAAIGAAATVVGQVDPIIRTAVRLK